MRMALPLRQTRNVLNMEIVSIEKKTFEMMLASFNALLQTLRDKRLIGYSQINRRFYYKQEEVKRLIPLIGTLYPGGR